MHKLMCTFATPMKKKIPDRNLDTSCPAGIPCNKLMYRFVTTRKKKKKRNRPVFRHGMPPQGIPRKKKKMPAILALRVMLGLTHLLQLYASPIDKTILANEIV